MSHLSSEDQRRREKEKNLQGFSRSRLDRLLWLLRMEDSIQSSFSDMERLSLSACLSVNQSLNSVVIIHSAGEASEAFNLSQSTFVEELDAASLSQTLFSQTQNHPVQVTKCVYESLTDTALLSFFNPVPTGRLLVLDDNKEFKAPPFFGEWLDSKLAFHVSASDHSMGSNNPNNSAPLAGGSVGGATYDFMSDLAGIGEEEVAVLGSYRRRPAMHQYLYSSDGAVTGVTLTATHNSTSEDEPEIGLCHLLTDVCR